MTAEDRELLNAFYILVYHSNFEVRTAKDGFETYLINGYVVSRSQFDLIGKLSGKFKVGK